MANTFFGLNIGKSGLYTYQAALNTAAHNASNVDTKGYSKQVANQSASKAISANGSYGMQGTGTDVTGVTQNRDAYYDVKYWTNNSIYGKYNTKSYYLNSVQGYFSEVNSDGITASLDTFYNTMSTLSGNVGDLTIRTQLTENAVSLTEIVNSIYDNLKSLQKECNTEIKNAADQINSIAERVSSLTKQINTIEITGAKANDLRDKRNLLIDELSELANVTVTEQPVGDDIGVNSYIVRIDGKILVDTYNYATLIATPEEYSVGQNDADGLYTLTWSDGQNFDCVSNTLGGKLQALFEIRDGNNKLNFSGVGNGAAGSKVLTVTGANMEDIIKLNIPATDGKITVGSKEYAYDNFTCTVDDDGKYTYTFNLKEELELAAVDKKVEIGRPVDAKGVPYYMAQINEFARTMAKSFNDIHSQGEDLYGKKGIDLFTGTVITTGDEFKFSSATKNFTFGSIPPLNADGTVQKDADGYVEGNYFLLTAGNLQLTTALSDDPRKLACAEYDGNVDTGIEDKTTLNKLLELKDDMSMFKQGTPDMFLQTMVAEMGIDTKTAYSFATSQDNILKMVDKQRASISGVDSDEEAMDLIKFRNAYDLSSKVISIMNQIYDKLINSTGL